MGQQEPTGQDQELPAGRGYGALLAEPTRADLEQSRITGYARWLADRHGAPLSTARGFRGVVPPGWPAGGSGGGSYHELWRWSVAEPGAFWSSIWDYFGVLGDRGDAPPLQGGPMPAVSWFSDARTNYARNALRAASADPDRTAIIYRSEAGHDGSLSYAELDRARWRPCAPRWSRWGWTRRPGRRVPAELAGGADRPARHRQPRRDLAPARRTSARAR